MPDQLGSSKPAYFVVLTGVFGREGKWVTAQCQELGTTAFGRTLEEADSRLREAILLHLQALEDAGERARFFRENGIRTHTVYPTVVRQSVPPEVLSKAHVVRVGKEMALV